MRGPRIRDRAPRLVSAPMSDLERAVETVVGPCLGVRPGEDVVVVVDRTTAALGEALRAAAARLGAEPVLCVMEPREVDGEEPPAAVAAALARRARVHRADAPLALPHPRPQGGERGRRARRDAARRDRGHARAADGVRLPADGRAHAAASPSC